MSEEKVRVAFVGGGGTAVPLLEDLLRRPFIDVVGIADVDETSRGGQLAKANGIFFTTDALVFASKGDEIDVLFELSGDPLIKRRLKNAFVAEGNLHTIIVHDLVARMMLSVAMSSATLAETFHPDDQGVG